jgi:glutamate/aspartate transport system permease protein
MNYDWSWSVFQEISLDGVTPYWEMLLIGVGWTLALALSAWVLALLGGSLLGVMRTASGRGWALAVATYVEVFRSVPLLVQMFLWYFVLPELLPKAWGDAMKQMPQPWGQFLPALGCLTFYGSARVAEQVRSGIQSLPRGQFHAATAMGLTQFQRYRHIIVPQAMRIVIPPLTSEFTGIIKYSSVALTIGLLELTGQARSMQEYTFHIFEAFSAATAGYLAINGVVVLGMRSVERRLAVPGLIGAGDRKA